MEKIKKYFTSLSVAILFFAPLFSFDVVNAQQYGSCVLSGDVCETNNDCRSGQYCITALGECGTGQVCEVGKTGACANSNETCKAIPSQTSTQTTPTQPKTSSIIPSCALVDPSVDPNGYCGDVKDLIELAINIGQFVFSIIGGLAFFMFIYGGIKMIMSFGNSEKFKEGRNILVAAVVGLAIAFGAYMAIDFILDALTVGESFRGV